MLYGDKSKEDLNNHIEKILKSKRFNNRKDKRNLYTQLLTRFNMPTRYIEELVTFKKDIKEFTPFDLFCVGSVIDPDSLGNFFTEDEIKSLSQEKFEEVKAEFPIKFTDMVQVTPDQWIGKITVKQLMEMKRSRMLNYDENEQRALKRIKSGQIEIFKPYVSAKNVAEIKEAMLNGTYIPDPITLNMPDGSEFDYSNHTLTVYSLPKDMFNLDDGYHRYLAISQIFDFNPDFDYTMELRIVNFTNQKANIFIYQQDQKTQMKKIVSDSYDVNSVPNKIVVRMNQDAMCNLQGMIGRNKANINSGVFAKLISTFFIKEKIPRAKEMSHVIAIQKKLTEKFNALTSQDPQFLGEYDDVKMFVVMGVFASDIPQPKYSEAINYIMSNLSDEEKKTMKISSTNMVRKKGINILQEKIDSYKDKVGVM